MVNTWVPVLILTLVFSASALGAVKPTEEAAPLPSVDQVLERYVDAVGGREAIGSKSTRVSLGRMVHDLHWRMPPHEVVPMAGYASSSGKILIVEHTSEGIRGEGFDGEVTWVQDASGVETRSDPIWPKMAWLMEPQGALRLEDYFAGLEVTARENVDGRVLYVLEPDGLDRAHYALYFDAETGLLVRIGYYWELKDYREVDGLYLPLRIDMSRKGGSSTLILDSVKHNLPLQDGLFAVPAEAAPPGE